MNRQMAQMGWRTRLRRDRVLQAELLGLWTVGALVLLALLAAVLILHGD